MSKSKIWLIIEIIAAIVLLILVGFFIKRKIDDHFYLKEQNVWKENLEKNLDISKEDNGDWIEERNKLAIQEVEKIRKDHKSVIGLIEIPGTDVLYPIVQGEDNWYYLDHDKDGSYHAFGEIFLDSRNNSEFIDQNSVIYGHNIRQAKTLFNALLKYEDQKFYEEHKIINIYSLKGFKSYEVIQAFHSDPQAPYRERSFASKEEYISFLNKYNEQSMVQTDFANIQDKENKNLITLSTCFDKKTRMVLQAIEKSE